MSLQEYIQLPPSVAVTRWRALRRKIARVEASVYIYNETLKEAGEKQQRVERDHEKGNGVNSKI